MSERLRPRDLAMLAGESPSTPRHNATVEIFEPGDSGFDYAALVELVADRISFVPRYRQKLASVPGHLANPAWVDDPDFDLGYHVRRSALPRPGSHEQLLELVARIVVPAARPAPAAVGGLLRRGPRAAAGSPCCRSPTRCWSTACTPSTWRRCCSTARPIPGRSTRTTGARLRAVVHRPGRRGGAGRHRLAGLGPRHRPRDPGLRAADRRRRGLAGRRDRGRADQPPARSAPTRCWASCPSSVGSSPSAPS